VRLASLWCSVSERTGHLWGVPDDNGRSECLNCHWYRLRCGDRPSLYSLDRSLVGTWSGIQPECDPKWADEVRAKLRGEVA
jgi:hypothetical protein